MPNFSFRLRERIASIFCPVTVFDEYFGLACAMRLFLLAFARQRFAQGYVVFLNEN